MDGKEINLEDAEVGENYPPMHPNCRSVVSPVDDRVDRSKATRSARNPVTGKTIKVPANMTYQEWYKQFVEGRKEQITAPKKYISKSDREQYKRYVDALGKNAPKTLDDFIELKYNNKDEWNALKLYKKAIQTGELTPLADFELYKSVSKEIDAKLVGITTANGIKVTGKSNHFIARTIGSVEQRRNGVSTEKVIDTLTSPISILEDIKQSSISLVGRDNRVSINKNTGKLIQANPIRSKNK